ncbi:hypothetical protein L6452_20938 [Arctium lappa]|uniref:Uncharacterized protein n=1 Tax=Arctium lappa TaxID=4217 RepID=A0ACB9BE20_ARCLA|nr:hypothetical protein L6452_20938 [Arctium lappa]
MEDKQICDQLPPLSTNFPWLVAQNLEAEDDNQYNIFYTLHEPLSHYRCRIPELIGRRIRACFHGWMILSNHPHDIEWSLWNPVTTEFIHLPRLILKDGVDIDDIHYCCLPCPPDDPGSILLLMRYPKPNILKSITGEEDSILFEPTCCNGKVYALIAGSKDVYISPCVIQVHIVVEEKEVVISLLPFVTTPDPVCAARCTRSCLFLKGSSSELFTIIMRLMNEKPVDVYLYKLDMTSLVWTEMKELKDTVFFVDLASDDSISWSPPIASKLGGYIHIFHKTGKVIYSIQNDHEESKCRANSKQDHEMVVRSATIDEVEFNSKTNEQNNEAHLFNIPCHLLEKIMEFCVGVEYLNFRATCKRCYLAAPVVRWSNKKRLQTYSLNTPWLVLFEKDRGIITFTDPVFGDNYFIKASRELFHYKRILCSRYGWLLLFIDDYVMAFFNPFTSDIRKLPIMVPDFDSFCFSAPPTSPDYMVVGISSWCESHWFHTFNRRNIEENFKDLCGTKEHVDAHAWIEPSWS